MRVLPCLSTLALLLLSLSDAPAQALIFEALPPVVEPCLQDSLCVTTSWTISGTDAGVSGSFEIPAYIPDPAQWAPTSGPIAFTGLLGPAYYANFYRDDILAVLPSGGGEFLNGTATLYTSFSGVGLDQTQVGFILTTTGCFVFPDSPAVVTCGDGNVGQGKGLFTYGPGQLAWTQAPLTLGYQVVFSVRKVQPIDPNENLGGFDWSGSVSVVYSPVPSAGAALHFNLSGEPGSFAESFTILADPLTAVAFGTREGVPAFVNQNGKGLGVTQNGTSGPFLQDGETLTLYFGADRVEPQEFVLWFQNGGFADPFTLTLDVNGVPVSYDLIAGAGGEFQRFAVEPGHVGNVVQFTGGLYSALRVTEVTVKAAPSAGTRCGLGAELSLLLPVLCWGRRWRLAA